MTMKILPMPTLRITILKNYTLEQIKRKVRFLMKHVSLDNPHAVR